MRSLRLLSRSALRLDARSRGAALRALACLIGARLLLAAAPYAVVRNRLDRISARRSRSPLMTQAECARAIDRAAQLLPDTRCLVRAVAAEYLLRREGHAAALKLGVNLDEFRQLKAHAWVESGGLTVTGGDEAAGYAPLEPPRAP